MGGDRDALFWHFSLRCLERLRLRPGSGTLRSHACACWEGTAFMGEVLASVILTHPSTVARCPVAENTG
jgi:hypothetical protein